MSTPDILLPNTVPAGDEFPPADLFHGDPDRGAHITGPTPKNTTPWYRNWRYLLAIGAVILAAAVALAYAGRPGPVTPSSVLKSDGYSSAITLTPAQVHQQMGNDPTVSGMFGGAAAGTDASGQRMELVIQVTDQGKGIEPLLVNALNSEGQGTYTVHTADGGKFLVMDGSVDALGAFGQVQ
jgi:hypothetical protein